MQKKPIPLASALAAANPGTAAPTRQMPRHAGGPGQKSSPNGARLQALANLATRGRTGQGRRLSKSTDGNIGKTLPATVGLNDGDADD